MGPVDVAALLREAAEGWRAMAAARGAGLTVEAALVPPVHGDPLRLAQAIGNLVANALEHGGGAVQVRVGTRDRRVRVEVTDDGPGLPQPVAELVNAAHGRHTRRGHGLAIAAGIARRHGGRVAAAPSAHGARVVLELPAL